MNGTKKTNDGGSIYCKSWEKLSELKDEITHKFANKFNVSETQKYLARIIVKNANERDYLNDDALVEDIVALNTLEDIKVSGFKICEKNHLVLEVSSVLRKLLL